MRPWPPHRPRSIRSWPGPARRPFAPTTTRSPWPNSPSSKRARPKRRLTPRARLDQAQAALQAAQASLDAANAQLAQTVLAAPFAGKVVSLNAEVGEVEIG